MINTPCSRQKSNIKGPNEQLFVTFERERDKSVFRLEASHFSKDFNSTCTGAGKYLLFHVIPQFLMAKNVICSFACPSVSRAEILDKSHYLKFLKFFMH